MANKQLWVAWVAGAASVYPTIAYPRTYRSLHLGRRMKGDIMRWGQGVLFIPNFFFLFQFFLRHALLIE